MGEILTGKAANENGGWNRDALNVDLLNPKVAQVVKTLEEECQDGSIITEDRRAETQEKREVAVWFIWSAWLAFSMIDLWLGAVLCGLGRGTGAASGAASYSAAAVNTFLFAMGAGLLRWLLVWRRSGERTGLLISRYMFLFVMVLISFAAFFGMGFGVENLALNLDRLALSIAIGAGFGILSTLPLSLLLPSASS